MSRVDAEQNFRKWTIFVFEYIIASCLGNIPAPLIIPRLNSPRGTITRTPWKIEGIHSRVSYPSWGFTLFSLFSLSLPPFSFSIRFGFPIFARVFSFVTGIRISGRVYLNVKQVFNIMCNIIKIVQRCESLACNGVIDHLPRKNK